MKRKELWKDIEGYEGLYQISNKANVKSLDRLRSYNNDFRNVKMRILKPNINNKGYLYISLNKNSNQKSYTIHRLVAIHFIPNPNNLPCVNHIDGDPLNDNDWNLEWATYRENSCHSIDKTKTSSKYIGVNWENDRSKWVARIRINGIKKTLGRCDTELGAYQLRCDYEKNNNIINKYL